jgi:hypothetical protein
LRRYIQEDQTAAALVEVASQSFQATFEREASLTTADVGGLR